MHGLDPGIVSGTSQVTSPTSSLSSKIVRVEEIVPLIWVAWAVPTPTSTATRDEVTHLATRIRLISASSSAQSDTDWQISALCGTSPCRLATSTETDLAHHDLDDSRRSRPAARHLPWNRAGNV
jgi:hypothetical protein